MLRLFSPKSTKVHEILWVDISKVIENPLRNVAAAYKASSCEYFKNLKYKDLTQYREANNDEYASGIAVLKVKLENDELTDRMRKKILSDEWIQSLIKMSENVEGK